MNRPIKFRAWDGQLKAIFNLQDLAEDTVLQRQFGKFEHINRFTGLLDSRGKEIYEGDILGSKAIVEWLGDGWRKRVETPKGTRYYSLFRNRDEHNDKIYEAVIGNIYENPDLIAQP